MTSPSRSDGCIAPHDPTRTRVWAPMVQSSSTAIAAEGPPMPVEVTLTATPSSVPVQVVYSRLAATLAAPSRWAAMRSQRPGSPGSRT